VNVDGAPLTHYTTVRASRSAEVEQVWRGHTLRIDRDMLAEVLPDPGARPIAYVCGPTPMVESVATLLVSLGHAPERIRTERFGPTG
jgi:ferredoxin-NADP reductase